MLFESRLLCAVCLTRSSTQTALPSQTRLGLRGMALAVLGFLIAWLLFYLAGWSILQLRERAPLAETSGLNAQRIL